MPPMSASGPYSIDMSDRFGQLTHIDVAAVAAEVTERWSNQTLTSVNDSVVRLGVLHGEFHWHKHGAEDEFFLVLSGELEIEVEGRDPFVLGPSQAVTIPRGVMHRPIARERTVILMVEPATVVPTGDADG